MAMILLHHIVQVLARTGDSVSIGRIIPTRPLFSGFDTAKKKASFGWPSSFALGATSVLNFPICMSAV